MNLDFRGFDPSRFLIFKGWNSQVHRFPEIQIQLFSICVDFIGPHTSKDLRGLRWQFRTLAESATTDWPVGDQKTLRTASLVIGTARRRFARSLRKDGALVEKCKICNLLLSPTNYYYDVTITVTAIIIIINMIAIIILIILYYY